MISSAEQLRILNDVVRRYPKVRVLETGGTAIWPFIGPDGTIRGYAQCLFYTDPWPLSGGNGQSVKWSLSTTGDDLYRLLDAAAKSLSS